MATTAVSTLILAIEARNDTRAALASVRADLAQQTEAAKRAASEQTLAVQQATRQQLLEMRQKTEAEAQAMRQSVVGQDRATREAMSNRIQMLRQDTAQTALLARENAENQIRQIMLVRDADIAAARARASATEQALREEADAARVAATREAEAQRSAGGGVVVGAGEREGERRGLPGTGLLESMGRFGAQMVLWNVGYAAVNRMTEAVGGFASGLVTANAKMEQFHETFAAIYQSQAAAGAATDFLTQFALKAPDTRENVMQAGETIASLGLNIKEVMTPLGNVAAVMGKDMPTAAQAFADAYEGRFQMLAMSLHITKGQLIEFGMQVDKSGHVLNNSFVPAFERLAQAKFGQGMELQMKTAAGVFSNVQDAMENLQRIMGKPMFALVKKDLTDFMNLLMSPGAQQAAYALGTGIGTAFHAISDAVRATGPVVLGAIGFIVGAWNAAAPAIQGAVAYINNLAQRVGTFLHDSVLPVIFQGLAAASSWWQQHAQDVQKVLQKLFSTLQIFWGNLGTNLKAAFDILHGIWMVGWGLISGGFGLALDLMSGNWRQFGIDLDNMATTIAVGLLEIFHGLFSKLVDLFARIPNPLDAILQKLNQPFLLNLLRVEGHPGLAAAIQVAAAASTIGRSGHLTSAQFDQQVKAAGDAAVAARGGQDLTPDQLDHIRIMAESAASKRLLPLLNAPAGATSATQAALDAYFKAQEDSLRRKANLLTGAPSTYDTTIAETKAGKNIFDDWMKKLRDLSAKGLTLPGIDLSKIGLTPGTGIDWSGGGGGEPFDPRSASAAQQKLITDAETRFQIDLTRGGLTQAQGLRDIGAIVAAQRAGGATNNQLILTALQDTKTLDEQLLGQAQKQFDFDAGVAHPSRQKLHQDELAYLKILAQVPGMTPLDLATAHRELDARVKQIMGGGGTGMQRAEERWQWDVGAAHPDRAALLRDEKAYLALYAQQKGVDDLAVKIKKREMDKQIADLFGAAARTPIAPVPRYGALAGETGYGQTTVSFGGAQVNPWQAMVAALREQITHLRAQLAKDDQVIALLELGNAGQGQQLGVLRTIAGGIARIPVPPGPAGGRSAHSVLKAAGSYAPVTR